MASSPSNPPLPPDALYPQACAHLSAGRLDLAEPLFLTLLQQQPGDPNALGMLGALRLQQQRLDDALTLCAQAHTAAPESPLHGVNLASALAGLGRLHEALALLRNVCTSHPRYPLAHYNLGNFLREARQEQAAADAYRAVLALDPQHLNALNNLGTVLTSLGHYGEADALFKQVLALDARNASAAGNLALLAATQGDHASAAAQYAHVPPSADQRMTAGVRFNQSLSLIRLGNYEEGFPLYESRWQGSPTLHRGYRFTPERQWRGEPLAGERLLVWDEQGFGDTLQCVRYLPHVAARSPARLTLATHPALLRLFRQSLPPSIEVIDRNTLPPALGQAWDFHCPIMSLPLGLAHPGPVRKAEVPGNTPYLRADAAEVERWERRLTSLEPTRPLRVGLSWRTGQADNGGRCFGLDEAGPLANLPGVRFYRLTRTEPNRPAEPTPEGLDLVDLTADLSDFAATAALMQCLDEVVSVDTSVLHLAGALNRPTLGVFPTHGGNFFDVAEGVQTWYPSLTVWRQPTMGDWPALLARVAQRLGEIQALAHTS